MIYLDNGSTTQIDPGVLAKLADTLQHNYYNPSAMHAGGLAVLALVKTAHQTLLDCLKWQGDFFFTSGGTEANNLAILGTVKPKTHVITTKAEHPSVLRTIEGLKSKGNTVSYVNFLPDGQVDLAHLRSLLTDTTSLVSIMDTNNETGNRQDTAAIGQLVKQHSKARYHVDGVAAFGKHPVNIKQVDMLTVSSHKIHGPAGVGGLYVKSGINLRPQLFGGHQQKSVRPGTEYAAGQVAFAYAALLAHSRLEIHTAYVSTLHTQLRERILSLAPDTIINTAPWHSPYILNVSIPGTKGQVVVNALSEQGVYCSTGAACNERAANQLKALGHPAAIYESAVRFSLAHTNTAADMALTGDKLQMVLQQLRP